MVYTRWRLCAMRVSMRKVLLRWPRLERRQTDREMTDRSPPGAAPDGQVLAGFKLDEGTTRPYISADPNHGNFVL